MRRSLNGFCRLPRLLWKTLVLAILLLYKNVFLPPPLYARKALFHSEKSTGNDNQLDEGKASSATMECDTVYHLRDLNTMSRIRFYIEKISELKRIPKNRKRFCDEYGYETQEDSARKGYDRSLKSSTYDSSTAQTQYTAGESGVSENKTSHIHRELLAAPDDMAARTDGKSKNFFLVSSSANLTTPFPTLKNGNVDFRMIPVPPYTSYILDIVDFVFTFLCGLMVLLMNIGFVLIETGTAAAKNAGSVMFKNMVTVVITGLVWWLWGFGIAFGKDDGQGLIGISYFVADAKWYKPSSDTINAYEQLNYPATNWLLQWGYCLTAVSIISGAIVERMSMSVYYMCVFIMTSWVYPIIVHWTWGGGWLSSINGVKYLDFAGSGVVHITGGLCALVGAAVVGPRLGRFERQTSGSFDGTGSSGNANDHTIATSTPSNINYRPHNFPIVISGTLISWLCWYGLNCGSNLHFASDSLYFFNVYNISNNSNVARVSLAAMNTTLSALAGGVTAMLAKSASRPLRNDRMTSREENKASRMVFSLKGFSNGILAGLVSITASCNNVHPYGAFVIGCIGGFVYALFSYLLTLLRIDDPVDASAVHFACGVWGVIAAGLFDQSTGLFHNTDIGGLQFGVQVLSITVISVWTGFFTSIYFGICCFLRKIRISKEEEIIGMDICRHGGPAYVWLRSGDITKGELSPADLSIMNMNGYYKNHKLLLRQRRTKRSRTGREALKELNGFHMVKRFADANVDINNISSDGKHIEPHERVTIISPGYEEEAATTCAYAGCERGATEAPSDC